MKKKIVTLAVLTICLATLASGTLAYFTAKDTAHNVITSGTVDIEIEEWQDPDGDRNDYLPYPAAPIEIMPGAAVSKIVKIKNLEADAYIRAQFDVIVKKADNTVMEITSEELADIISVKTNGNYWERKAGDNEWWYYNESVKKDHSTNPLFTEVTFSGPNMTNKYQGCTVEIVVNAQAVQTANNGNSAMDAVGW